MAAVQETVDRVRSIEVDAYKYGFVTDIESDKAPKGLDEDTVRFISAKKGEPEWLLEWRLEAYRRWLTMEDADLGAGRLSRDRLPGPLLFLRAEVDAGAEVARRGRSRAAEDLRQARHSAGRAGDPGRRRAAAGRGRRGVRFGLGRHHLQGRARQGRRDLLLVLGGGAATTPSWCRRYLGSVVPPTDNFYATLNSAVFSDGSFVYVPPGVRCPMELSTYFRINEKNTGQFERTLIIADKGAYVSYLEGCTAPKRDENQLHAAVVELIALEDAEIKYSTVQNWYPGDAEGKGGIYNFVTKRGDCRGARSKISWTQVETGSAITWKYPSCILRGEGSRGEFYSIAISNGCQQVDSGTKMIHLGRNTTSRIISKGIAAGRSQNTYRGQVSAHAKATGARNFTNCDSLLIGDQCGAHTVPYIEAKNSLDGVRARGDDLEDLRGPAVLLPAARAYAARRRRR